ncbi:single-stranded DNA-binding protein, partial [Lysinibacillus sp. NPDC047702]
PNAHQPQQPQPQYGGQAYGNNQPNQSFGGSMSGQGSFGGNTAYQQNQPPMNQPNYTRVDEDPFANNSGPIEVSEDDLPF